MEQHELECLQSLSTEHSETYSYYSETYTYSSESSKWKKSLIYKYCDFSDYVRIISLLDINLQLLY